MCDGGNGNVYDIADDTCDQAADAIEALLTAAELLEQAEETHANCDECGGENVPELCPICFPLFDDARIARRLAIAKVRPTQSPHPTTAGERQ